MKFTATIYVDGIENSYKAVELYREAFGLSLGYNLSYEDVEGLKKWGLNIANDYVPQRGYFHANLERDGETVFSVSAEGESVTPKESEFIQLIMEMGCEEAVKKAVYVLSEGKITPHDEGWNPCAAGVTDQFNVSWCICV